MYNLYSILKTHEYDVLLVRRLHLVSRPSSFRALVRTTPPAPFLTNFTLI
jgi:hypothetical protein